MIKLISSVTGADLISPVTGSGTFNINQNISSIAPDLWAFVVVFFQDTTVNLASGQTFGATIHGDAMNDLITVYWNSNHGMLKIFELEDPDTGTDITTAVEWEVGVEAVTRNIVYNSIIYSGVDSIDEDNIETVSGDDTGSSAGDAVTVNSTGLVKAGRVLTVHAWSTLLNSFISNTQRKIGGRRTIGALGGELLTQDAFGGSTVVGDTTMLLGTAHKGGIGIPLVPSKVMVDLTLNTGPLDLSLNSGIFRIQEPNPDRDYLIPALPPLTP